MLRQTVDGMCMALADSVPGVSGGTIAFIMGFYDSFISSIHNVIFGTHKERLNGISYLAKLGVGWIIGMAVAVSILASLFENHVYVVHSLFLGLVLGSIPLVIHQEKQSISGHHMSIVFGAIGMMIVISIAYATGSSPSSSWDLSVFSFQTGIQLFLIGMIAISAMFLPGISGSTLLLIFGAYMPVITAVKELLHFNLNYVPSILFFLSGIVCGAASVVKLIQICMNKYRPQSVYFILGMMAGSLYAIVQGPTTLTPAQPDMSLHSFSVPACIVGILIIVGIQFIQEKQYHSKPIDTK